MTIWVLLAFVVAIAALRRVQRGDPEVRRRLDRLEEELRDLRQALERAGIAATPSPAAADVFGATAGAPGVAPAAEPGLAPTPASTGAPLPADMDQAGAGVAWSGRSPIAGAASAEAPGGEPPPVESAPDAAPPEPPVPPSPPIDWERWIGVRGAAVVGGAVLALAGLFFFRYSIEHGLIPPWLRVVLGTLVGIGCVAGSERLRRGERDAGGTANALAGGGVVVLYAAFWAAGARYDLIGPAATFVLLVAVTAACCALAWRHDSLVIATIGLVGGFLTPVFASSGADRPIGLFVYLMMLDAGLLYLARRRHWPLLGALSLLATVAYQALWIGARMGPDRLWLGLVIVGAFGLLYAFMVPREPQARSWTITHAGGVLLPFAFAIYFAGNAELSHRFTPIAALLALLSLAAGWLTRQLRQPLLGLGAAGGGLAVVIVWVFGHAGPDAAWPAVLSAIALAATFHLFVELDPDATGADGPAPAAALSAVGYMAVLIVAATTIRNVPLWPWLVGWSALGALLCRHGGMAEREPLQVLAALGLGLGLSWFRITHGAEPEMPSIPVFLGVQLAVAVAFQAVALARAGTRAHAWAEHAAAAFAGIVLLVGMGALQEMQLLTLAAMLGLGILIGLAGTRLGGGPWLLVAVLTTAAMHTLWSYVSHGPPLAGMALQLLAVLLFTAWPFLAAQRLHHDRWSWWASALAGPAWFWALGVLFEARFGDDAIGLLPLALGAVTLAAAQRTRTLWSADDPVRTSNLAWYLAVTLGFVTVAVPLQLDKAWITIAWALEGVAVLVLWQRLDHAGLKWFGVALLLAVTVRLVANPAVLTYWPRPSWRLVNWLMYTYLVPAAALLHASTLLAREEMPRLRDWERPLYPRPVPFASVAVGLAGLVVVFVWLNLAIAEWFATGPVIQLHLERLPARDLTTSIVWALYALGLLALGVRRDSRGLRWVSLGLMMITIAKVFLYDLGELRDLYRVASLLGLAVSLIVVSLAYQRFVLRPRPAEEE